jgi:hypothetical protein
VENNNELLLLLLSSSSSSTPHKLNVLAFYVKKGLLLIDSDASGYHSSPTKLQ